MRSFLSLPRLNSMCFYPLKNVLSTTRINTNTRCINHHQHLCADSEKNVDGLKETDIEIEPKNRIDHDKRIEVRDFFLSFAFFRCVMIHHRRLDGFYLVQHDDEYQHRTVMMNMHTQILRQTSGTRMKAMFEHESECMDDRLRRIIIIYLRFCSTYRSYVAASHEERENNFMLKRRNARVLCSTESKKSVRPYTFVRLSLSLSHSVCVCD